MGSSCSSGSTATVTHQTDNVDASPAIVSACPTCLPLISPWTPGNFFCPVCCNYFADIYVSSCCANLVCDACSVPYMQPQDNDKSIEPPRSGRVLASCPFCSQSPVSLKSMRGDQPAPQIHSYTQSAETQSLLASIRRHESNKRLLGMCPKDSLEPLRRDPNRLLPPPSLLPPLPQAVWRSRSSTPSPFTPISPRSRASLLVPFSAVPRPEVACAPARPVHGLQVADVGILGGDADDVGDDSKHALSLSPQCPAPPQSCSPCVDEVALAPPPLVVPCASLAATETQSIADSLPVSPQPDLLLPLSPPAALQLHPQNTHAQPQQPQDGLMLPPHACVDPAFPLAVLCPIAPSNVSSPADENLSNLSNLSNTPTTPLLSPLSCIAQPQSPVINHVVGPSGKTPSNHTIVDIPPSSPTAQPNPSCIVPPTQPQEVKCSNA